MQANCEFRSLRALEDSPRASRKRLEVARRFDRQSRFWRALTAIAGYPAAYDDLFAKLADEALLPKADHRALDLGTGTGALSAAYRRKARADHRIAALDLSTRMLARARGELGERRSSFTAADATTLPFRTGMFHVVMAAHCLEHAEDPSATIREMTRVLCSRGLLVCVIGRPGILDSITRRIWRYQRIEASDVMAWMWDSGAEPLGCMNFGARHRLGHWLSQAVVGRKAASI